MCGKFSTALQSIMFSFLSSQSHRWSIQIPCSAYKSAQRHLKYLGEGYLLPLNETTVFHNDWYIRLSRYLVLAAKQKMLDGNSLSGATKWCTETIPFANLCLLRQLSKLYTRSAPHWSQTFDVQIEDLKPPVISERYPMYSRSRHRW